MLCYPLLFEVKDFYISSDPAVLIDDIKVGAFSNIKCLER